MSSRASLWVSRVRVTGGFLADLDIELAPGLNVIVGPRGAGKTTLLELVRHALGVRHADSERDNRQAALVETLLGAGEVILDLRSYDEEVRLVVDATGAGRAPGTQNLALMLGQNELEGIASSSESRLALIDLRADAPASHEPPLEMAAQATRDLGRLRSEIEMLVEQLRQRTSLQSDLEALRGRERELMAGGSAGLSIQREELSRRETELRQLEQWEAQEGRFGEQLRRIDAMIGEATTSFDRLPSDAMSPTFVRESSGQLSDLEYVLREARELARRLSDTLSRSIERNSRRESKLRLEAAPIRASLDEAEKGLGDVTARLRNVEVQLSRLDMIEEEIMRLRAHYRDISTFRDQAMADAELAQEERYVARLAVAETVSRQLGGRVSVTVEHLANATSYRSLLNELLQGSGLQYRALADSISRATLPRTLVEIVEAGDVEGLTRLTDIPMARAARLLSHLDNEDALYLLTQVRLEDRADFFLRDGSQRKGVETLSTGQKCAVTLPIALTEHSRSLILDQPEDHLDNAYLVDTIVAALVDRTVSGAQTIVATHNANIPVLGEASRVFSMNSDGKRGSIKRSGRYDHPPIVDDITELMEGGAEAFVRRARFYELNGHGIGG